MEKTWLGKASGGAGDTCRVRHAMLSMQTPIFSSPTYLLAPTYPTRLRYFNQHLLSGQWHAMHECVWCNLPTGD